MRLLLFLMGRNLDISFISEIHTKVIFQNTETYYCQSDADDVFTPWASIYMRDLKSLSFKLHCSLYDILADFPSVKFPSDFPLFLISEIYLNSLYLIELTAFFGAYLFMIILTSQMLYFIPFLWCFSFYSIARQNKLRYLKYINIMIPIKRRFDTHSTFMGIIILIYFKYLNLLWRAIL